MRKGYTLDLCISTISITLVLGPFGPVGIGLEPWMAASSWMGPDNVLVSNYEELLLLLRNCICSNRLTNQHVLLISPSLASGYTLLSTSML